MAASKPRQSNFEILRIIAILLIIAFHYVYKAGWDVSGAPLTNRVLIDTFGMFGEIGVDLFVLISGYFLINGRFSWKKLVLLLIEVMFYNYLSLFIISGCDISKFLESIDIYSIFPTILCAYWFTTAYVLLYLFSPYLSKGLKALDMKEYAKLVTISIVVWCIIPTVMALFHVNNDTEVFLFYNRFIWMVVLFVIGGFISLHGNNIKLLNSSPMTYFVSTTALFAMLVAFIVCVELHPGFAEKIGIKSAWYFWPPNTVMVLGISVALFMGFKHLEVPCLPIINKIATTTLGVYLLHDGKAQSWLWHDVFQNATHVASPYLVLWILGTVLIVFAVGVVIDLIRQFPEKWISKGIDSLFEKKQC